MVRPILILIFLVSSLSLFSCGVLSAGGGGVIETRSVVTETSPDGTVTTTEATTRVSVDQPEAAKESATILINRNGEIRISTGKSHDATFTVASLNLLRLPMYAGIGMILIGVAVGYFLKSIRWGAIIAGTGVAMIVLTWLLAQYAAYFLAGLGILLIFGVYAIYDYWRNKQATQENIKLVDQLKEKGYLKSEDLKAVAPSVQSKTTKKLVDKLSKD